MTVGRKEYTAEEVAGNDGSDGSRVWIIVHGIVYDVTDYLEKHPGGEELIMEYAGGDATEGFEDFGHSSDAKRMLKKFEVGVLVESTNRKVAFRNESTNGANEYTLEEVARNDGSNGSRVWIILRGSVYDVTDYLDQHPGGAELIMEYAGTDASEGFDDFGHSSDAKRMLKKFEIGTLVNSSKNNERNNYVNSKDYAKRRRSRVRRKFLSTILGPCASKL